jgi:uncharacterized repeat protein (TIGR01451 family)
LQSQSLVNLAEVTATTPLTDIERASVVITTAVIARADMKIVLESTPTAVGGLTATVHAEVTNLGPSSAAGTVVTLTLPPGTTFESVVLPSPEWVATPTLDGDVVVTTTLIITPGNIYLLDFVVNVDPNIQPGTSLEFVGEVTSETPDPDLTNNQARTDTSIIGSATLRIAKYGSPESVVAGGEVTYTIVITNEGPSEARFVDVKDQLPAGLTMQSIVASDGACAGTLCEFGTVAYGATRTVTLIARVGSDVLGVVTNTAAVDSVDNAAGRPVTTEVTTTVTASAALRVSKVALNDPAYAGGNVLYQIVVTNDGPSDAQQVVVTDTLPLSTTYVGGDAACTGAAGEVICQLGALAAGASRTLLIQATIDSQAPDNTVITNLVTVSSPTATDDITDTVDVTVRQPVGGEVDLEVSKQGPTGAATEEEIVYTIVVTNHGPAMASAVTLIDALPEGVLLVGVSSSQGACNAGISCLLGDLAADATATIVVTGTVADDVENASTLVNLAHVASANPDTDLTNNQATAETVISAEARLTLVKEVAPASAVPGATVTYRIVVNNHGPATAKRVVVSDVLPVEVQDALVSSSIGGCNSLPCALGDLRPGDSATILVVGKVASTATGAFTNTATVGSDTTLSESSTLTNSAVLFVGPFADLALALESGPTAIAGQSGVVTATVSNIGLSAAEGAVVTVTLPGETTFSTAMLPPGWYATPGAGNTVVLTTDTVLDAGASIALPIVVEIAPEVQPGSSLQYAGVVTSATTDPNLTNNLANADMSIIGQADLAVQKNGPVTATAGTNVTYTIIVTNNGPSEAVLRDIKDTVPEGIELLSATLQHGNGSLTSCAAAICQSATRLAVGEVVTMTVTGLVNPSVAAGVILTNTATAFTDGVTPDPDLSNNQSEVKTTVTASAALRVSKVALNDPAYAGGNVLYQIVVTNDGPSDAQQVVVTDTLPLSTTYVGGDAACTGAAGEVICQLGALAAGASRTLLIQATIDSQAPDNTVITNLVTVSSPTATDDITDTVDVTVRQPVNGVVDLVIEKQGPAQAVAGQLLTYTLVVTNLGPATATDVQIVDALPVEIIGMAVSASQGACNNSVVCHLSEIEAGMTATVVITGWVRTETLSGTLVLNQAVVSSNNSEQNPADNSDSHETVIDAHVLMSIEKTVQPTAVAPGGALSYRIVVQNFGPSVAHNVVVTDILPVELEAVQVTSSRGSCTDGVCTLGSLPPGETATILILGSASFTATSRFTNTALLTTDTALDPDSVTEAEAGIAVGDNADLVMAKSAPASVAAGDVFSYVLTVRNAGPSSAVNVQVEDTLPAGVDLVDGGECALVASQRVLCPATVLPVLAANAEVSWTLVVRVHSDLALGSTVQNRATVSSDTLDPDPTNNTAMAETSIVGRADLQIHKAASALTVTAGSEMTYTIIVSNVGPADAVSVRLVDVLPAQVRLVQPIAVERSLATDVPVVCLGTSCETSVVLFGEIITLSIRAVVESSVAHLSVLTNTAVVHSLSDPNANNNVAYAPVTAVRESTLTIVKSASPEPAMAGMPLVYRIVVRNLGPSDADGVLVGDLLPAGFLVGSVSSTQGECSALPCALGILPSGAQAVITIQGVVDPSHTAPLVNLAAVTATTPLTQTELTQVTITTTVEALADLSLVVDSTPTAIAGLTATVQAQLTNLGPSAATGAVVTLTLPPGASLTDIELPPGWFATPNPDGTVTLTTTTVLQPGEVTPFVMHVALDAAIPPGSSLAFDGVVTAETPDQDPTNNRDDADTSVIAQADLVIFKQGPASMTVGDTITYIITAVNLGPSVGSVRDIKDTLPEGIVLRSASLEVAGGGTTACAEAICQGMRPLAVGEVMTMTVVGVVDPALPNGAVLTNTATIFAENITPDPVENNNQAHHAAPVTAQARIGIDKFDLMDPVNPGAMLVYGIVVTNTGPAIARNVVLTDTLPPHVTYHSSTGACAESTAGIVSCQLGDLEVGARRTFLIVVMVNADAPSGYMLYNVATITSATPLIDSILEADEPTRILPPSGPMADLEIVKSTDTPVVGGGDLVTFTLMITNHGPSPVSNAQALDLLPDGLTLVSISSSQGFCNAGVNCLLGALDFGVNANGEPVIVGTATITIVARAAIDLADGSVITNTAYVESEKYDPQPQNNLDEADVTVVARYADVYLLKAGALLATAGEVLTYTLTVGNYGPATAENVVVSDPLPAGVRYLRAIPAPTGGSAMAPIWELGSLAMGVTTTIQVVVEVDPQAPPALVLVNTARVDSTTPDTNLANNQATVTTQSYGAADLEVIKTAGQEIVYGDDVVYYTITVNNLGPSLSDRVDIKDLIPPGTDLLSLYTSQGVCVNAICQLGNIPVGESVVITAAVQVISPTFPPGTVLTNTAVAFTNTPDPNPENNQDSDSVIVGPVVNLSVLKTSAVQTVTVGTIISYTMIVTNHGPSTAPLIIVTDHMPSGFVYLSSTAPNGCVEVNPRELVCNGGALAANRTLRFNVQFFVSTLGSGTVRNTIVVDAPGSNIGSGDLESDLELPTEPVPTAILLDSYDLFDAEDALVITWKTVSELRTAGFRLWRAESSDRGKAILLTPDMIPATGIGNSYTYVDSTVHKYVTYWYWLQELTIDGGGWEYSALSGRIGGDVLFLPMIANREAVQRDAAAPVDAAPTQMENGGFTLYLTIIGSGFDGATPDALPEVDSAPQPSETPMPEPTDATAPLNTPTSPEPSSGQTPTPTAAPTVTPTPLLVEPAATPAPLPIDTPTLAPTVTSPSSTSPSSTSPTPTAPGASMPPLVGTPLMPPVVAPTMSASPAPAETPRPTVSPPPSDRAPSTS